MKTVEIKCATCGNIKQKPKSEIDRQKRNGRSVFYCNLKCAGKNKNNIQRIEKFKKNVIGYVRQPDEQSKFRWYIKQIIKNSKKRNQDYDIDIPFLSQLWEQQGGICPFTKQKLILRTHAYQTKISPFQASLDRLDNSKGYIKGNVRFVSLMFNYARNIFSDSDVIDFCNRVANNNK